MSSIYTSRTVGCALGWMAVGAVVLTASWVRGESGGEAPPADVVPHAGLSAEEAVRVATLPEGFSMRVFAAEPDVRQPIAFCLDHRGRVWVAEGFCYPKRRAEGEGLDRILVFEDSDGDHRFDKRTVFMEGLNLVSGLEVGFGGVWIGAAPYLMFVPVNDWENPRPAGEARILLDGWDYEHDTHETLNTFTWGPDGWLYGCHGVFCPSLVGKPGAPESERQWVDAAVWRYHPTQGRFEVFAEGTSNPWGIDFDERGQCWIEACVIPHLWHMIQGARYQRQGGAHYCISLDEAERNEGNREGKSRKPIYPYVYEDIKTVADHVHWAGDLGPHAANARSDAAGGGHAHAGLMIYLGDSWPEEYRGRMFMGNIHGQRLNVDVAERRGSGYKGRHGPDFLNFHDTWSQSLNQLYDQDGSMYIIDWYDKNQCHHNQIDGHDRANGRIYKVIYGEAGVSHVDVRRQSDEALVDLLFHRNEWYPRHAQRVLQERAHQGRLSAGARERMVRMLVEGERGELPESHREAGGEPSQLRLLWAVHVTGGLTEEIALRLLGREEEYVRAWAVQFLCEDRRPSEEALREMVRLARTDRSPVVRLYLMSALQRLPVERRWELYAALNGRGEDRDDHNIPLMAWYGGEPLAVADPKRALDLALESRLPKTLNFTARRIASMDGSEARDLVVRTLAAVDDPEKQLAILSGLAAALQGERSVPMPDGWEAVEARVEAGAVVAVRARVLALALKFGSDRARDSLRQTVMEGGVEAGLRRTALEALVNHRDPELPSLLRELIGDAVMRREALRGLAGYDDAGTPGAILGVYGLLQGVEKREALNALTSRTTYAAALLDAVERGEVPARDLTADLLRQLRSLNDAELERRIEMVWGEFRESGADVEREIARLKQVYWAGGSQPGDASRGRSVYVRTCQQCHVLYGVGGKVGPDITGSNRSDLDYLLQTIVDPNAVIPNEYRASNLETLDGRVLTGIVQRQDDRSVTILTADEELVIPRDEIEVLEESELSMMPEALLDQLEEQELRDLIYYLTRPGQAPLVATVDTLGPLFNGRDLSGWQGAVELWRVEDGEVVGRTSEKLERSEFLVHDVVFSNFRLVCQVKLTPNSGNSGIQFRSRRHGEHEMRGYQADIGAGWWGKLYEEHGRGLLWDRPGDHHVRAEEWNTYEIVAVGSRVMTAINGQRCVDLEDAAGAAGGILGLQLHAGAAMEVRFKDFEVELDPEPVLKTVR